MPECLHLHRRLIAKDDVLEFAECLDCGEILEAEKSTVPQPESETLSDA
jgi:hypothetical protein